MVFKDMKSVFSKALVEWLVAATCITIGVLFVLIYNSVRYISEVGGGLFSDIPELSSVFVILAFSFCLSAICLSIMPVTRTLIRSRMISGFLIVLYGGGISLYLFYLYHFDGIEGLGDGETLSLFLIAAVSFCISIWRGFVKKT